MPPPNTIILGDGLPKDYHAHASGRDLLGSFWLGQCFDNDFCQQSQWVLAFLLLATICAACANFICFYQMSVSRRLGCLYGLVQIVFAVTVMVTVGGVLAYVSTQFKEQVAAMAKGSSIHHHHGETVSLTRILPEPGQPFFIG